MFTYKLSFLKKFLNLDSKKNWKNIVASRNKFHTIFMLVKTAEMQEWIGKLIVEAEKYVLKYPEFQAFIKKLKIKSK